MRFDKLGRFDVSAISGQFSHTVVTADRGLDLAAASTFRAGRSGSTASACSSTASSPSRRALACQAIERQGGRLRWVWASTKVRPLVSDDRDVKIEAPTEHGASSAIFERDTGVS